MIVGVIMVFRCDDEGCKAFKSVDMDVSVEAFEASWFSGLTLHYCPDCKEKPEHQEAIEAARKELTAMRDRSKAKVSAMLDQLIPAVHSEVQYVGH